MKKIALLTLLLINLSLSFSLPRNQASPAIFSVTKTNNSILFRHTDSTLTAIPCQSVASIVSNADPSKIVSVWVVQQGDYDKIMQFDYLVCGFSSKSDAVDSLTAWAICDTSSGGGGSSASSTLLPNGIKVVTESRDLQADDAGWILLLQTEDINIPTVLNIPYPSPLEVNKCFALVVNNSNYLTCGYASTPDGLTLVSPMLSENVLFTTTETDGGNYTSPVSTAAIDDKTALRYLYDQSQNAIPLGGTVSGSPVTGDIEFQDPLDSGEKAIYTNYGISGYKKFFFPEDGTVGIEVSDTYTTSILLDEARINLNITDPVSPGIKGIQDFSANITDLDYPQKIYVDNAISSIRKVDTSYTFRNSTLDSLCQITVINGISYRSCGKDSVGAGSSTLALDKISDAVDSSTLNAGNYKQEWQWNSLANNTGFKLSSTSGGLLNTQNRLFEVEMSGAMPGTGNRSYAGYFRNTQTVGVTFGLYAEGSTNGGAIHANGAINIDNGRLYLGGGSGALFYRNSGNTFIQGGSGEGMILQSNNGVASINCGFDELGIIASRKTLNQRYVLGIGGSLYQGSAYLSVFTTATLIERDLGKLIFSANTGLAGGYASFTPNNIMTINGGATEATSNVGIGTTTPVASAKLEVSSTTSGFLPPRMTATQASAISTPAQGLLLFVSDTNGTFTSVGWWGYNGSTWEKLNN